MAAVFQQNCAQFLAVLSVLVCVCNGQTSDDTDKPRIYSLHIRSDIQMRFATTLVTSRAANNANVSKEAVFDVTLPDEAFISNFTMEIDGVMYPGSVEEKEKAKKKFEAAKKRGQSAGHVSQKPRDTNKFKVQVNVAAFNKVTFYLTYQELLKRTRGVYEHKVYVNPGQPVDDLKIDVSIQESRDITTLSVPPIRTDLLTNDYEEENSIAVISRPSSSSAIVQYHPTVRQQSDHSPSGLAGQFVVEYDIERSMDAGDLLVVNGYFVHLFAPAVQRRIPKDVLFILDISGSMMGTKLEQLKDAMLSILNDLIEGDRFNIMAFSKEIHFYQPNMTQVNQANIVDAKKYVDNLQVEGWTNIDLSLREGIDALKKGQIEGERSPLVLFLTDGDATWGEMNNEKILENVKQINEGGISVFSLAFGADADWGLVKKVAQQNDGVARKIYEDSDASLQIAGFYDELAVTLLKNVSVRYLGDDVEEESITPSTFKTYFQGSEMVIAGKLSDAGASTIKLELFGDSVDGNIVLSLDSEESNIDLSDSESLTKVADFSTITEKTWAYLTIKELLKRESLETNTTVRDELKAQALQLSLKHGFVTPLTSMIVTKPEGDTTDEVEEDSEEIMSEDLSSSMNQLAPPGPQGSTQSGGFYYRSGGGGSTHNTGGSSSYHGSYGGGGGGDPHYMVRIYDIKHPICFDVRAKDGEIYNLLTDPSHGVMIKAGMVKEDLLDKYGEPKTFIGELAVQLQHHVVVVTPDAIILGTKVYEWTTEWTKRLGKIEILTARMGHMLQIRFDFGARLLIKRHMRSRRDPNYNRKVNFLNVYLDHEDAFSKHSTGLLGQFVNGQKHVKMLKEFKSEGGKSMAKLRVKEGPKFNKPADTNMVSKSHSHRIRANLLERSDLVTGNKELCWMVHTKFEEMLLGSRDNFLETKLLEL